MVYLVVKERVCRSCCCSDLYIMSDRDGDINERRLDGNDWRRFVLLDIECSILSRREA